VTRFAHSAWLGFMLLSGATGCGGEEDVSLTATLLDVRVNVTSLALGSELSGGFGLRLELGEYAPEPTQVSLGAFSLRRDQLELVSPLPLAPAAGVVFPVSLTPGEVRRVELAFDASSLLDAAEADAVCTGPLAVVGAVTDTLGGGKTTGATAAGVTPQCSVQ
jgi:hypothetical protein